MTQDAHSKPLSLGEALEKYGDKEAWELFKQINTECLEHGYIRKPLSPPGIFLDRGDETRDELLRRRSKVLKSLERSLVDRLTSGELRAQARCFAPLGAILGGESYRDRGAIPRHEQTSRHVPRRDTAIRLGAAYSRREPVGRFGPRGRPRADGLLNVRTIFPGDSRLRRRRSANLPRHRREFVEGQRFGAPSRVDPDPFQRLENRRSVHPDPREFPE